MEENNKKTKDFEFPIKMQQVNFTLEDLQAIKNEALINPFRALRMMKGSDFDEIFTVVIEFLNNEKFFNSVKNKVIQSASKGENFLDRTYSIKYKFTINKKDQKFIKYYKVISDTYLNRKMSTVYSPINLNDKFEEYICSELASLINNYFHKKEKSDINIEVTSFRVTSEPSEMIFTFGIRSSTHEKMMCSLVQNKLTEDTFK